jgi:Molydopterin dinucleotide binding domain
VPSANTVVVCTGAYQRPHRPTFGGVFPDDLAVIDAEEYRNPAGIPAGRVLVVGSGQTGARSLRSCASQVCFCETPASAGGALRKSAPDPLVEMHPSTADSRGIRAGDWVSLETPLAASVRGRSSTPLSTPKSSSASMAGGGL